MKRSFVEVAAVYSRLKMIPDLSIRYPEKRNLYRWSGWLYGVVRYGGVAALVLILFGIIFYWMGEDKAGESHSSPIVARLESKEIGSIKRPQYRLYLKIVPWQSPKRRFPSGICRNGPLHLSINRYQLFSGLWPCRQFRLMEI